MPFGRLRVDFKGRRVQRDSVNLSCLIETDEPIDDIFAHHAGVAFLGPVEPSTSGKLQGDPLAGFEDILGLGMGRAPVIQVDAAFGPVKPPGESLGREADAVIHG